VLMVTEKNSWTNLSREWCDEANCLSTELGREYWRIFAIWHTTLFRFKYMCFIETIPTLK
jgi:hypothetical protein